MAHHAEHTGQARIGVPLFAKIAQPISLDRPIYSRISEGPFVDLDRAQWERIDPVIADAAMKRGR